MCVRFIIFVLLSFIVFSEKSNSLYEYCCCSSDQCISGDNQNCCTHRLHPMLGTDPHKCQGVQMSGNYQMDPHPCGCPPGLTECGNSCCPQNKVCQGGECKCPPEYQNDCGIMGCCARDCSIVDGNLCRAPM